MSGPEACMFLDGDWKNDAMSHQESGDELLLPQVYFMLKVSPGSPAGVGGRRSRRGDTLWCLLNSTSHIISLSNFGSTIIEWYKCRCHKIQEIQDSLFSASLVKSTPWCSGEPRIEE